MLVFSLLLTAFFSGMEIAFVTASKLKIELLKKQGTMTGKILGYFIRRPSNFLGTTLVGINIALIIFSTAIGQMLAPLFDKALPSSLHTYFFILFAQTLFSSIIILVVGEFIPKALFRINPNGILTILAWPFQIFYFLLYPLASLIVFLAGFILKKIFRLKQEDTKPEFTKTDLENFIEQIKSPHREEVIDTDLFENALDLSKVKTRECLVPRTEIEFVESEDGIDAVLEKFLDTKLSRIIITRNGIDNILGYVHHQSMLQRPEKIQDVIIPVPVVPESMPAHEVMNIIMKERKNMAWVVDEFGGTSGVITLEDILEELFGEIRDEHDEIEFAEKKLEDGSYIFSGRLELDYIKEKYDLEFPAGDYETLSGFLMQAIGEVPELKSEHTAGGYRFTIIKLDETRIETVRLRPQKD